MNIKSKKEVRIQYMLPHQIQEEFNKLPLIFLPLATLEWHGPHLVMGVDPINAEFVALALAKEIGGVVLPTWSSLCDDCSSPASCVTADVSVAGVS